MNYELRTILPPPKLLKKSSPQAEMPSGNLSLLFEKFLYFTSAVASSASSFWILRPMVR